MCSHQPRASPPESRAAFVVPRSVRTCCGRTAGMAPPPARKRVLIIGGGAAGTAAAWSLSRFPERFAVSLWEAAPVLGGVATTERLKLPDGSEVEINDGACALARVAMVVAH